RKGYDVLTAANGGEAMLIARRHSERITLLITDVVMPEMNGPAVADYFRETGYDMPVLFVSGYPADLVAEHGIQDGALNYLPKPFSTDGLARKVREVLDGRLSPLH
ncbi:MAG TPA: response regulator, partial [Longimicrobiales bacterium]|nr:response regulator [Longimicrobiales bacterium]